jgi:hypothetical protein
MLSYDADNNLSFSLTTYETPEPSSLLLLASGLAGVWIFRLRRERKS